MYNENVDMGGGAITINTLVIFRFIVSGRTIDHTAYIAIYIPQLRYNKNMAKEKPKVKNTTTNIRQRRVIEKVLESNGKKGVSTAMREVGYGKGYAKNPQLLTATKSWQELMDEYLSDDLVAEKHQALLMKSDENGDIDANAVKAGVDMAYKIKGRYAPEKIEHSITAIKIVNYGDMDGDNPTT